MIIISLFTKQMIAYFSSLSVIKWCRKALTKYSGVFLPFIYRNGVSPLSGKYNTLSFADKFADKEIAEISVECEFEKHGCIWRYQIKHYDVSNLLDWFFRAWAAPVLRTASILQVISLNVVKFSGLVEQENLLLLCEVKAGLSGFRKFFAKLKLSPSLVRKNTIICLFGV